MSGFVSGGGQCTGEVDVIEHLGTNIFLVVDCGAPGALTVSF